MKRFYSIFSVITLVLLCVGSYAQQRAAKNSISTNVSSFVPEANLEQFIQSPNPDFTEYNGRLFLLMQFDQLPSEEEKARMGSIGVDLFHYIPHNTYLASLPTSLQKDQLRNFAVRSLLAVPPSVKMTPEVYHRNLPEWALIKKGKVDVNILYFDGIDDEEILAALKKEEFEVLKLQSRSHRAHLRLPIDQLDALAQMPMVSYIECIEKPGTPDNYTGRTLHRSNVLASDYAMGRHYDGTGINVMMQDDGVIGPHIDYEGRIGGNFIFVNNGNHGDHVGGIIMGAGNLNPLHRGQAFGADLYVYGAAFQGYPGFDSIWSHYFDYDIHITSTSYSNGCNAGYTALAQTMDEQVRTLPALMHVFSAGNSGTSNCGYGAGNVWGNVTGGHKMGKNVITVANLNANGGLATSSSRGPAHDGRIKPDISAKGTAVTSTVAGNSYDTFSGTSMSCPGVSGTLAQLYQGFEEITGAEPTGGLMKAILLNTATDIGNPGPDFKFGWGQINGLKAILAIEESRYETSSINVGGLNNHVINVPTGTQQVRFMVYWTDFESFPNSSQALVNNLDMTVTDPNSNSLQPLILNSTPNAALLDLPAVPGVDSLNNMEQVVIDNPTPGNHTITVQGTSIPQGPQTYFVVYEFEGDGVELTYPIGGESFAPGETEKIHWDAFGNTGNFTLEYSINDGNNWTVISSTISGADRSYDWLVPNVVTGKARFRVTRGSVIDVSDDPFSIIGVPSNVGVDWACPDSFQLSWTGVVNATGYEIFKLGNKYMEPIATSTSNLAVVTNVNPNNTFWFAVRALGIDNAKGRRSIAEEKTPGIFSCFIPFDAQLVNVQSPGPGTYQDCQDLKFPVTIDIFNNSNTAITNFPVQYTLGTGAPVIDTVQSIVQPSTSFTYTFNDSVELSSFGSQPLLIVVDHQSDGNQWNDSMTIDLDLHPAVFVTLPWAEDFESFDQCSIEPNCGGTSCPTDNGWSNQKNGTQDDVDWRTNSGQTFSGQTGPSLDHKPGNGFGNYLYLEGSGECNGQVGNLVSPCIDLANTTEPKLTFWYHMLGNTMGDLHFDVFDGTTWILDVSPAIIGNQGNSWQQQVVDLSPYIDQVINVRFRGITGPDFRTDMAIDDIAVNNPPIPGFTWKNTGNDNEIIFTDSSQFGDGSILKFPDLSELSGTNGTHTFPGHGAFDVTQVVFNACGTDSITQTIFVWPTGIGEAQQFGDVRIYPNPNQGQFTIELSNSAQELTQVRITELNGKVVATTSFTPNSNQAIKEVSLPELSKGIYFIHVSSPSRKFVTRISVL